MAAHDPRLELAPRDIVARAIDFEMKKHGLDHVWLDATHLGEAFLVEHFPTIHARCLELGIDIARQPIPVVPAAHYTCGGVVTDLDGRTDLPGLYAVGETTYTGLHGANRLASNSLLECVVVGRTCAARIDADAPGARRPALPDWDESRVENADEQVVISHNWDELRLFMWNYVGIVRTTKRLDRALRRIHLLRGEIDEYYASFRVNRDLLELRNLVDCAELVVRSGAGAPREPRPALQPRLPVHAPGQLPDRPGTAGRGSRTRRHRLHEPHRVVDRPHVLGQRPDRDAVDARRGDLPQAGPGSRRPRPPAAPARRSWRPPRASARA